MEILLNLAWAALALLMVCLWLRLGGAKDADRRRQIIAIAVLIAILFPVISVSDDLMAVQGATETDSLQRRDYLAAATAHPVHPFAVLVSALAFDLNFGSPRFVSLRNLTLPSFDHPELGVIGDRAPPAA